VAVENFFTVENLMGKGLTCRDRSLRVQGGLMRLDVLGMLMT